MQPIGETLRFMQQLWELAHALEVSSKRMGRTIGVTGPQRLVIRVVGQAPGITARDLADVMGIHPSTLTGILARLDRQRFLVRTVDPDDRRVARFKLTAAGRKIDRTRKGTVEAAVRRALARADDPTVATTSRLLQLLVGELTREV
jgi:DNA-binding MarR family transcriptional regulator